MSLTEPPFDLEQTEQRITVVCRLPLQLPQGHHYASLWEQLKARAFEQLTVDFSHIVAYDTFLVVFIRRLRQLATDRSATLQLRGLSPEMERLLQFFEQQAGESQVSPTAAGWRRFFERLGESLLRKLGDIRAFFVFLGSLIVDLVRHPHRVRWEDLPLFVFAAGVSAVPIVSLIALLIGVILGYQGAVQLHRFGADVYLADLIAISVTRELGPLMTAIIVAGRTGSAFAAEIGTMKINEELDALQVMGIDFVRFLLLPRILAVVLTLPLLSLIADVAGIVGGLLTALTTLDFTISGYLLQTQQALNYAHVFTGIFKSFFFGFVIGIIGCFQGLRVSAGSASVGRAATIAVVTSILLIIVLDAVFAVLFQVLGI